MTKAALSTFAILMCSAPVFGFQKPMVSDANALKGVWTPVKWELAGKSPAAVPNMTLTLTEGQYELVEGPSIDSGRITIRPNLKIKEMDIVGVKGPNAGRTIPAIYRFEKDMLTICYGLDGKRPKLFESPKKTLTLLVTYSQKPMARKPQLRMKFIKP